MNAEKSASNRTQPSSKFAVSDNQDKGNSKMQSIFIPSDASDISLVMYNAHLADLVDLDHIQPIPPIFDIRKYMEIINITFMRTCKLKQMAHNENLDLNMTIKNVDHIAEVLELIIEQKSKKRKMFVD